MGTRGMKEADGDRCVFSANGCCAGDVGSREKWARRRPPCARALLCQGDRPRLSPFAPAPSGAAVNATANGEKVLSLGERLGKKAIDSDVAWDRCFAANRGAHRVCVARRFVGDVGHITVHRAGRKGTGPCFRSTVVEHKDVDSPKNGPVPARPVNRRQRLQLKHVRMPLFTLALSQRER